MSSSVHDNNKTNNILVLGKDFTQGINVTTLYAEKLYSIKFTENNKKLCLSLHYNGDFKAKDYEIVATPLCLGNTSKDISVYNMKKKQD